MTTQPSTRTLEQLWDESFARREVSENRLAGWLMAANSGGAVAVLSLMGGFVTKSPVIIPQLLALLLTLFLAGILGAMLGLVADVMLKGKIMNAVHTQKFDKGDKSRIETIASVRRYVLLVSGLFLLVGAGISLWSIWQLTGPTLPAPGVAP